VEKEELVVCDTNILIEVIDRNNQRIIRDLIDIGSDKLCISSVSYSELILGATNRSHLSKLIIELQKFPIIPLTPTIDLYHRGLLPQFGLSHKLSIQDALIAATAIENDCTLFTLNKKDFRFINELKLI
jgi:predicted nucleic acid-binding protein